MPYYSQHGEDVLIDRALDGQQDGFFVEVGCIDGRRFSNTLAFEERGWRGICIEAHTDFIPMLRENRPGSIVVHCAAGARDAENVVFHACDRGSLSTLDPDMVGEFMERESVSAEEYSTQQVPMRSLCTVFAEHGVDAIDVLSLDIEGYELEALAGMDLARYRPRMLVIEQEDEASERRTDEMLAAAGYIKSVRMENNIYYVLEQKVHERLLNRVFAAEVIHTPHPMADTGSGTIRLAINTAYGRAKVLTPSGYMLFKLKRLLRGDS